MVIWGVSLILGRNFIFDRGHHQEFISLLRNDRKSPSLLLRYIVSHVAKTAIFYSSAGQCQAKAYSLSTNLVATT